MRSFRLYWPAIITAMIVSFLFEVAWFSVFLLPWLTGLGHDKQWLETAHGIGLPIQCAVAMLCAFITASILSIAIQTTGPQTLFRGIKVGAIVWLGFIATTMAKSYIFELRPASLYGINLGYALLDILLIGAIVGAWKSKPRLL